MHDIHVIKYQVYDLAGKEPSKFCDTPLGAADALYVACYQATEQNREGMWAIRQVGLSALAWKRHPDNPANANQPHPAITDPPQIWDMPNGDIVIVRDTCVSMADPRRPSADGDLWVHTITNETYAYAQRGTAMWAKDVRKGTLRAPATVQAGQVYDMPDGDHVCTVLRIYKAGKSYVAACRLTTAEEPEGAVRELAFEWVLIGKLQPTTTP